jgi:hypothetical protein
LIEDCPEGSTSDESDGDLGFDVTHGEFWQMGQEVRNHPPSPESGQFAAGPTVRGEDVSLVCDYQESNVSAQHFVMENDTFRIILLLGLDLLGGSLTEEAVHNLLSTVKALEIFKVLEEVTMPHMKPNPLMLALEFDLTLHQLVIRIQRKYVTVRMIPTGHILSGHCASSTGNIGSLLVHDAYLTQLLQARRAKKTTQNVCHQCGQQGHQAAACREHIQKSRRSARHTGDNSPKNSQERTAAAPNSTRLVDAENSDQVLACPFDDVFPHSM